MKMKKSDVALRGDFATVDEKMRIIDRRAGRIKNSKPFIKQIQGLKIGKIKFLIGAGVGHRTGVVMRGKGLSEKVSDNDLHKINIQPQKVLPLDKSREAKFTAQVLNKFLERTHQILKNYHLNKKREKQGKLSVNYLLLRTAGRIKPILKFSRKWRLKPCCIAGAGLYKGIGKALGMDLINVKGATGDADTDISAKFKEAKKCFKKYDFCFLHIKATEIF
jgi:2,3-bisphosphoglycerate-independent phosphoglycerate mutase